MALWSQALPLTSYKASRQITGSGGHLLSGNPCSPRCLARPPQGPAILLQAVAGLRLPLQAGGSASPSPAHGSCPGQPCSEVSRALPAAPLAAALLRSQRPGGHLPPLLPGARKGSRGYPCGWGGGFHRWPRPNLSLSCRTLAATFFSSFGGAVSSRKLRSRLSSGTKSSTFWTFPGASAAGAGSGDGRHQLLPGVPRAGPTGQALKQDSV